MRGPSEQALSWELRKPLKLGEDVKPLPYKCATSLENCLTGHFCPVLFHLKNVRLDQQGELNFIERKPEAQELHQKSWVAKIGRGQKD